MLMEHTNIEGKYAGWLSLCLVTFDLLCLSL